jgi:probable HAF family extracellular repeat protein
VSLAFAINEHRQVVGYSTTPTGIAPFSWKDGVMTPLALPAGVSMAIPLAVNDAGVIIGLVSSSPPQSIRWESATSVGQVMETVMVTINTAGVMGGGLLMDCAPYGAWHAARILNGQVEHLAAAEDPCRQSLVMAINNAGDMLLYREEMIDDVARIRGAVLRNGQETIIEPLPGFGSASPSYHALNDAGDVAFTSSEPTDGGPVWITTGAMWLREGVVALPDLNDADGFDNTMVGPMNIHGVAAGTARAADGRTLGVLFHADIDRFAPTVTLDGYTGEAGKGWRADAVQRAGR